MTGFRLLISDDLGLPKAVLGDAVGNYRSQTQNLSVQVQQRDPMSPRANSL
jgi:hypothetical protein